MKITATIQETISAKPTTQKMLPAYSPARRAGEAHGHEAGDRHECARQHRGRRMAPGIGGRLDAVHALFHFHHHHLDGDDGVVDEKAERQDERAERDAVEEPAGFQHDEEHDGKRQRHGRGHDDADAPAEAEQAHQQHHAERHREFHHELADRRRDVHGLVADLGECHAERQGLCDRGRSRLPAPCRVSSPFQPCCITAASMMAGSP